MQFCLPDLGEGIVDAELVEWLVQPGASVQHGQNIAEVMTDKAAVELPSPFSGTITRLLVEPGQHVQVGEAMMEYEAKEGNEVVRPSPAVAQTADQPPQQVARPRVDHSAEPLSNVQAAPSVRRMARQLDIELTQVPGSGPNNRVLSDDLASFVKRTRGTGPPLRETGEQRRPLRDDLKPGTRIKLRGLRRTIAERIAHAKQTIPHYSYVDECDVSELVQLRLSLKERFDDAGIKLTYLPFFVTALVSALREVPLANATLDEKAGEIVLHDSYHIGIATDTPRGLVVPVLRDAQGKDLPQIAREIQRLTESARAGKATRDELRGSTFTITSIGGIGGLISTPIINPPEVGILGIGRIVKRPTFDDIGNVRAAHLVYLSFSFDHRVVDGAVAARLSNALIAQLKSPAALLLPGSLI